MVCSQSSNSWAWNIALPTPPPSPRSSAVAGTLRRIYGLVDAIRKWLNQKYSEQAEFFAFFRNFRWCDKCALHRNNNNKQTTNKNQKQRACNIKSCWQVGKERGWSAFQIHLDKKNQQHQPQYIHTNIHLMYAYSVVRASSCVLPPNLLLTLTRSIALAIEFLLKYLL